MLGAALDSVTLVRYKVRMLQSCAGDRALRSLPFEAPTDNPASMPEAGLSEAGPNVQRAQQCFKSPLCAAGNAPPRFWFR